MRTFFLVSFLVLSLFVVGFYAEEEEEKTVETQTQQPVEKLRSKLDSVSSPSDEEIAKLRSDLIARSKISPAERKHNRRIKLAERRRLAQAAKEKFNGERARLLKEQEEDRQALAARQQLERVKLLG